MGKISSIAKLFGEAAKAEETAKAIALGSREGALTAEGIGKTAREAGVTPQQIVRAEKRAGQQLGRASGYSVIKAQERSSRIFGDFPRPVDFPQEFTAFTRRSIQRDVEAAKKLEPKAYQSMKDWTSAPAGTPAPEEPLRKITSSVMGEYSPPQDWMVKDMRDRFMAAAKRGTLPAAAAAAGGAYAAQGWGDTARDLYTGPDNSHRTPTVQWGRNRQ